MMINPKRKLKLIKNLNKSKLQKSQVHNKNLKLLGKIAKIDPNK